MTLESHPVALSAAVPVKKRKKSPLTDWVASPVPHQNACVMAREQAHLGARAWYLHLPSGQDVAAQRCLPFNALRIGTIRSGVACVASAEEVAGLRQDVPEARFLLLGSPPRDCKAVSGDYHRYLAEELFAGCGQKAPARREVFGALLAQRWCVGSQRHRSAAPGNHGVLAAAQLYISPLVTTDLAAFRFFGWMLPRTFAELQGQA